MQCEKSKGDRKIAANGDTLDEDVCIVELLQAVRLESPNIYVDQSCNIDCQHEEALSFLKLGQCTS